MSGTNKVLGREILKHWGSQGKVHLWKIFISDRWSLETFYGGEKEPEKRYSESKVRGIWGTSV